MPPTLSPTGLSALSEFLATRIGLNFPRERWSDLERGIAAVAPEFGFSDAESCARWLLSTPLTHPMIETLASHLTVGETYFFREPRSLEVLENHILPALLARHGVERRLRIWSAGCCTGEEPYSIAMLLDRLIPDQRGWNITILATDINSKFLRKAAEGVYGEWSFRGTPAWLRERHFKKRRDGCFEIAPHLKRKVTFSYLNLADDAYPSLANNTNAMDVIFCRNVLMYFTPERVKAAAQNYYRSLVDGGWLIVSPAETSNALFAPFTAVAFPGVVLYRKTAEAEHRATVVQYPSPALVLPPEALTTPPAPIVPPEPMVVETMHAAPIHDAPSKPVDHAALSRNARECANQGRLAEATGWCEKAIAADKLNPAHYYLLATIRQEEGQTNEAVQSLNHALYLNPGFVLAHFALGNFRLSQGRHREAERHFGNALALLRQYPRGETLPESDGLTAGRLAEIIASVISSMPQPAAAGA
ncbi:MAG: chemotaxis protein CheR [Burkholderiales bacterium]|nr:chemotaxis protein CheR [Burkholderiales bacterium]